MKSGNRVLMVICIVSLLAGLANVPDLSLPIAGVVGADGRGPLPFAGDPVWTDTLDDSSHAYIPVGGLQGVEIVGGEVRLLPGSTEGWVATEVISCPSSYKYDLAYLETDAPGGSSVKLTVLDPSKEPSEVGYANETISPYVKQDGPDLSLFDLAYTTYPNIRLQVNLLASGTDRPTLLAWTVFFIGLEDWRDDFFGTSKMFDWDRLNFTGDNLEVNLSRKGGGGSVDYDKFPAIMAVANPWGAGGDIDVIYPNAGITGYNDPVSLDADGAAGFAYGDLNGDGYLDMVVAQYGNWGGSDSEIFWGQASGTWTRTGSKVLDTASARKAQVGDFNGDGELDFVITCDVQSGGGDQAMIWLNGGSGSFTTTADITISASNSQGVDTGDINGDGYDDIILGENNGCRLFLGGPSGPSTTAYRTYQPPVTPSDALMMDLDLDGYLDIAFPGGWGNDDASVYMGAADGPDTTADYTLNTGGSGSVHAGDINGDGYVDLAFGSGNDVKIYEGDSSGWSDSKTRTLAAGAGANDVKCPDLDQDGYADIVCCAASNPNPQNVLVWFGKSTWPTAADITKDGGANWQADVGVAMPKSGAARGYRGTFTTDPIYILPEQQKWDILLLEGTMPQNTTVTISILDSAGKEITGWKDLTDWNLDLSPLTGQSPILVKVTAASEFNWTTPVLDRITVKWMAKGYWREQFYGPAKIDRQVNVGVSGGELGRAIGIGTAPQLLVTSMRADAGFTTRPQAFIDGGGLDYLSLPPLTFEARGVAGADVADVNGDGFLDIVFAVNRISDTAYDSPSLLFLGSAVGFRSAPDRSFPTVGATDVLLRDINGDGHVDIVFAQQTDGLTPRINSSLYWGLAGSGGWASKPDVQFETNGASGVVAADLGGDAKLDLAFACMEDASSTSTNSMVFLQETTGFCGTSPSHLLPTKKAKAVAAGDINGDGRQDLVFANSFWAGSVEIDSPIYWGKAGGGFETTPGALKTVGAEDVKVADVDGDADLDVVFANTKNNAPSYRVDSYVYLNGGSGTFPVDPSARLPTTGAVAVAVVDLDGTGRKDLVFACQQNGTSYNVHSMAFLGGSSGWSSSPDIELPTVGASDVVAASFISAGKGGYMSTIITPEVPTDFWGAFHTFRYTTTLGAQQTGKVQLIDALTWEVLAETAIQSGTHEWVVKDLFWLKEHPKIRAVVTATGLDKAGAFTVDELYLNWTKRVKDPPRVLDLGVSHVSLLRMRSGALWVNVTDEYDPAKDLRIVLEHRLNGTSVWSTYLFNAPTFSDGSWRVTVFPRADAAVGMYDVRVNVTDSDHNFSGRIEFQDVLEVLNNVPTTPVVQIVPEAPLTTTSLRAEIVTPATDIETGVVYRYMWFKDGELVDTLTEDIVTSAYTSRSENWSVEVRAFDGLDEGPPALAWVFIHNAPPQVAVPLPNPEMAEDTVDDRWLDLGRSFSDPDGDALTYTVTVVPEHIAITIDPATGKVTMRPDKDWYGQETATFVASDGLLTQTQTVLITVTPVNDAPRFTTLNGAAITSDPMNFEIMQGGLLVITVGTEDVEGDELVFSVNTTAVDVDTVTGEMRFQPGNDVVGTVRYAITMYDAASTNVKVRLNITIKVLNVNDPPGEARITNPRVGDKFKVNQTLSLIGTCTDPDTPFGQVLNYTWWWNGTHLLGYGSSLTVFFEKAGNYTITVNVTDGEFFREASVAIEITPKEGSLPPPPPPPPKEDEGLGAYLWIIALVVLVVVGGVIFLVMGRRKAVEEDELEDEEEKREALQRMAVAVKETAEQMERELGETKAARAAGSPKAELEEIKVEGAGGPSAQAGLSMDMQLSEQASKEVAALFKDVDRREAAPPTQDQEVMRLESTKRKYQTAISRLPYGIPAAALKDKDWPWLAAALATGEKKTTPDGREVTKVEGHWYFTDVKDASSFLTEHGARPKAGPKAVARPVAAAAPAVDKAALLAKLEERFIMGQISEKAYEELKRKYQAEIDAEKPADTNEWEETG